MRVRHWHFVISLALTLGAVALIAHNRDRIWPALALLRAAQPSWLLVALALELTSFFCASRVYARVLRSLGYRCGALRLWIVALVAIVLSQSVPMGGMASYAFLVQTFRRQGVAAGHAALVAASEALSYASAMLLLFGFSLVSVGLQRRLGAVEETSLGAGAVAAVVIGGALFGLTRDQTVLARWLLALKNRVARAMRRSWSDAPIQHLVEELARGRALIAGRRAAVLLLVLIQLSALTGHSLALLVVLYSLGVTTRLVVVLAAFGIALITSTFNVLPGGGGTVEAAFGSQWPLIERWAGRAGLLIAGLLLLIVLAGLLGRWAIQHETELRARWAAFLSHPKVVALRARFAPQLAFLEARLSPTGYLGLELTSGIVLIVLGSWLFGGIAEDVVHGDPLVQLDLPVSQFLLAHAEPPFTAAMLVVSFAGSYLIVGASLVIGAVLAWWRRWYDLSMLVLAVGGGELINLLLNTLFARHRPTVPDPLLTLTGASFPSGHAMAAMICYGLLVYLSVQRLGAWRWRVLVVVTGVVLIVLIGFSRIYLGVQYLSDVLGGYAAGVVWLAFTMTGIGTLRRRRQYDLQPATAADTSPPQPKGVS
jgi:membrane-associated phospholipid phosphatase/uncharacterized membrane protein YbhN (UPF0104 family)